MESNKKNDDTMNESTNSKESEEDKSFVTKVRSRVSGLLSSSLSLLFKNQQSGVIRPRSIEDDEVNETQPPCKKSRGMVNESISSINSPHHTISRSDFLNHVSDQTSIESPAESVAGPSFISTKSAPRIFTSTSTPFEAVNRGKYVSSECTSGYSSMIKSNERHNIPTKSGISDSTIQPNGNTTSEKRSLFNMSSPETPSRSLFANMSPNSQDKTVSLSSRRPSFNGSNLGSPSFVDRTLTTNRIINSPFYNGSTMYGGASAYGQQLAMNESRKQQLKNSFMVKPINRHSETKSFTSLSKTARRILETLEQCSSPMSDVKKVPLPTRTNNQGLFSKYVAANPYSRNSSMSKELLVPTVSERLKMKQIQRLQDTTNEIRQIASSSNSNLNQEEYKIATESQQRHTNKMKTKVSSVRTKAPAIEVLDDFVLNPVPLMLPENKCPTFKIPELNISMPKDKSEEKTVLGKENSDQIKFMKVLTRDELTPQLKKDNDKEKSAVHIESNTNKRKSSNDFQSEKNDCSTEFTFSKPLVIADNAKPIIAINNFKFSEPLSKKIKIPENDGEKLLLRSNESGPEKLTNGSISCESDSAVLKKTNDPLLEKFKPPEGTWECQTCLIRNKSEVTKCAACETPKTEKSQNLIKTASPTFGLQFTKKVDEWDCSTCLVRNKLQNSVCVACSTPKMSKLEANGISHKFSSNEWECETCWVRNKNDAVKCVACESTRGDMLSKTKDAKVKEKIKCPMCLNEIVNGEKCSKCDKNATNEVKFDFPSHLKPSADSWECGTCLIRNKNELKVCAACETPREKQSNDVEIQNVNRKSDKWECPTCMVRNEADKEKCPCCETAKPGITLINKNNVNIFNFGVNKMQFSFGIPKDMQSNNSSAVSSTSSLFANDTNQASSGTPVFKFGITSNNEEKDKVDLEPNNLKSSDSVESKSEIKPDSSSLPIQLNMEKEKSENFQFKAPQAVSEKNSIPVFKFGAPTADSKDAGSNLFKFTPPKPLNVEDKLSLPSSESVKQSENNITSFLAPSVSQSDSSKPLFSFGSKDNDTKNQTSTSLFSFGSKDNDTKNQKTEQLFSFGSSSSSTKPGGFNFNAVKADSTQQSSSVPSFLPNPLQQSSNISQGGTTLKNGGFNFGSTAMGTSQAAVFNFGASSNPTVAAPLSKGGFDFSSAAKPTEGFNFSSPVASFDSGSKPTFNFTGGSIPTFSANPSDGVGGTQPVRKFKRAVRRTQR